MSDISNLSDTIVPKSDQLNADQLLGGSMTITVTDVRRVNEAAAVHDLGGVNVLVRRPGVVWDGHVNEELMQKAALIGIEALRYDDYPSMRRPHNPAIFDYALDNDAATVDDAMKAMRRHAEVVVEMATRQQSRSN